MQFAYALNVSHTAVEVDGDVIYIRVPRSDRRDELVTFDQAWAIDPDLPRGHLLLGVDEDQQQLVLDLASPNNVHAAVIGMTGSGKSTLMRTMILSALKTGGVQVALFRPEWGAGFVLWASPHLAWRNLSEGQRIARRDLRRWCAP